MSSDRTIVFYGVRRRITQALYEDERMEVEKHPIQFQMQALGLNTVRVHARDEAGREEYLLFLGAHLGSFGATSEVQGGVSRGDLIASMRRVDRLLRRAGVTEEPRLHSQYCPKW